MLDSSQPWNLFGLDLRQVGYYFRAGWREFLWDAGSPVLAAVDEVVCVRQAGEQDRYYCAGQPVGRPANSASLACTAILLPDELVLVRHLEIPRAAEPEIDAVMAMEINSSSPFTDDDTSAGWTIQARGETHLDVALVISSRSAVMAHVARHYDSHDVHEFEIWADIAPPGATAPAFFVLPDFGEVPRHRRNAGRMRRLAMTAAYCVVALVVMAALATGTKYLELQREQAFYAQAERESADVMRVREQVALSKSVISQAQALTDSLHSPRAELRRLTQVLGNETWLSTAEIKGRKIKIEGESGNAAAVMQQLLENPDYASVEAPIAFKKVRSGMERFVLNLTSNPAEEGP
jgi:general secretion pathway protein L